MTEKKTNIVRHTLTFQQQYDLAEILRNRREAILKDRPHRTELARQLAAETKLPIPPANLLPILQAIKLEWAQRTGGGYHKGMTREMVAELLALRDTLKARVETLESEVAWMRKLFRDLYVRLGEKPPEGYEVPSDLRN